MMVRKGKLHIGGYHSQTKDKFSSAFERRKTIGKHLSFGASEAYKLLRTNLIFSMADESECKVIGMTSALRGEGKSTTSINLAYTLAQSGKRVLLLEADMRIPVIGDILYLGDTTGLSHVLAGISSLNDAVHQNTLIQGLSVLPAGEIPPNPSELLSSKKMELVLQALTEAFEYIIIDLPPINAVSDGLAISRLLSGMIMVVRQDYCDRHSLAEAMRRMELLKIKVLGFVLNGAEPAEKRYRKYGYSKYKRGYSYTYGYGKEKNGAEPAVDATVSSAPAANTESGSGKDV